MILSDQDIEERLDDDLVIEPIQSLEEQLQPASFDCRLSSKFKRCTESYIVNPFEGVDKYEDIEVADDETYILDPGEFVLGSTEEWFEIPDDILAHVEGRSSLGRLGVQVHVTAGIIDPGFEGDITLEFKNVSNNPVMLIPGMRISQITFTQLSSDAERPYGDKRGSKYQSQSGPTGTKVHEDFK